MTTFSIFAVLLIIWFVGIIIRKLFKINNTGDLDNTNNVD